MGTKIARKSSTGRILRKNNKLMLGCCCDCLRWIPIHPCPDAPDGVVDPLWVCYDDLAKYGITSIKTIMVCGSPSWCYVIDPATEPTTTRPASWLDLKYYRLVDGCDGVNYDVSWFDVWEAGCGSGETRPWAHTPDYSSQGLMEGWQNPITGEWGTFPGSYIDDDGNFVSLYAGDGLYYSGSGPHVHLKGNILVDGVLSNDDGGDHACYSPGTIPDGHGGFYGIIPPGGYFPTSCYGSVHGPASGVGFDGRGFTGTHTFQFDVDPTDSEPGPSGECLSYWYVVNQGCVPLCITYADGSKVTVGVCESYPQYYTDHPTGNGHVGPFTVSPGACP